MSILIKGMEMPKDGCHHLICVYADGTVLSGGGEYTAIPVPPHGRLIDLDALPHYTGYALSADEVAKAVDTAPTIIEAEEGEAHEID